MSKYFTPEVKAKQKTLDERKQSLKRNATKSELVLQGLLLVLKQQVGRAIFQKGFIAGNGYCICDFYIPKYGLCIEVDGGYHFTKEQQGKDNFKNNYLIKERKFTVFRITNNECFDLTPESLLAYINECKTPWKKLVYSKKYYV